MCVVMMFEDKETCNPNPCQGQCPPSMVDVKMLLFLCEVLFSEVEVGNAMNDD